jgi:hypothetical protein
VWEILPRRTLILSGCLVLACAVPSKVTVLGDTDDRELFLRRVDEALKARNPDAILALSDVDAWRRSGRPQPAAATLTLPPAPITRVQDDPSGDGTDTQALYQDGRDKRWRLRLQHDEDGHAWRVVLRSDPCPRRGGMARGLEWDRGSSAPDSTATWTPLECWPLPQ